MGILTEPLRFVEELKLPKKYSVCELGDQWITCVEPHRLSVEWHRERGCGRYESIDANGRGTVTHDLNLPMPEGFGDFDLVTDFGTGEHVFNQFQVWKTVHHLTKVGGYIAFDRPSQGYRGHCFYNTHPNLILALADANAYDVINMEQRQTPRGELVRGLMRRTRSGKFHGPQQARYRKILKI